MGRFRAGGDDLKRAVTSSSAITHSANAGAASGGISRRSLLLGSAGAIALSGAKSEAVGGETRSDTVRYVTPGVVNALDPVMPGATPEAMAVSTYTYDRLLRFGQDRLPGGTSMFAFDSIEGELAERHDVSEDGLNITVYLRPGSTWHDGSPVTAEDVKWSLDRAVSAATMAKAQLASGSLERPEQFRVVGPLTVQIRLERPDRLAMPNLATNYAPMFNSQLAKRHASDDDPWAARWLKDNTAGGGAFTIQTASAVGSLTLVRNERWSSGRAPPFRRAIVQTVPEAVTRGMLVARGDADLAVALPPEELRALQSEAGVDVVSTPMPTGFGALIFNTALPPFDDVTVRRALAAAIPYEAIFRAVVFGQGKRLFGAPWMGEPPDPGFPQPLPFATNLDAARRALAVSSMPNGFSTTLTFGAARASFAEPAAVLIKEAFAAIGVNVRIEKLPDAQMAQAMTDKRLPMLLERSFALFPSTEYFFGIFASGPSRWNFSSWSNPEVDELLPRARFARGDAEYGELARRLVGLMADQVPMATIWQPSYDVAIAKGIAELATLYNYYPDLRTLSRA